ncbi:MAG TPA: alpha/beta hydrolase [Gemmataceae bacterium]|jgi:acetyl esterase/lipase|nr:alpha/beta hydrolase [Gemmataceae bacterium]
MRRLTAFILLLSPLVATAAEPTIIDLWPGRPPGETKELPPEADINKPTDALVGGRKILKITNVSKPTLAIYRPEKDKDTGAAMIICPGGGHFILAYDHEGTETAEFLAKHGVTGIVLKYRVPSRDKDKRWLAAVHDAQRAIRLVRSKADEWKIDPNRIGILGFSAGGETAGLATLLCAKDLYPAIDDVDKVSARPDFTALIYPAYLVNKAKTGLEDYAKPTKTTPPMFLVYAYDDPVDPRNALYLALAMKDVGVSCELHMYATGGHGYGMRDTGHPVNSFPDRLVEWMTKQGYLKR